MQKYINATRDHVNAIVDMIRGEEGLSGPDDVRIAVSDSQPAHLRGRQNPELSGPKLTEHQGGELSRLSSAG
jgi:hypothetical protein